MKKNLRSFLFVLFMGMGLAVFAQPQFSWAGYPNGALTFSNTSAGVTLNLQITGNQQFINNRPSYNAFNVAELTTQVDWTSSANSLTYSFILSTPLIGVNFRLYDVDQNTGVGWDDRITIVGVNNAGQNVYPLILPASYQAVSGANNNVLEGNADNIFFDLNYATVTFGNQNVKSFTVVYSCGAQSPANPNQQWMGIGAVGSLALATLPVNLTGFTAKAVGYDARLQWETEAQVNFDHFEIERSASGTGSFEVIGLVAGNNGAAGSYTYADVNVGRQLTTGYYRLKMVDRDGRFEYSRVAFVRFGKGLSVDVRPTLLSAGESIVVNLAGDPGRGVDILLYNAAGQVLESRRNVVSNRTELSTSSLHRGLYIVQVIEAGNTHTYKVTLQ